MMRRWWCTRRGRCVVCLSVCLFMLLLLNDETLVVHAEGQVRCLFVCLSVHVIIAK